MASLLFTNQKTSTRRIALLLASVAFVAGPASAAEVTVAAGSTGTLGANTSDRYVVDGVLHVTQSGSDVVSVDKSDTVYGSFSGSTTPGAPGTLSFSASAYYITATIGFVDQNGTIVSVLTTNDDDVYNLSNSLSGVGLIGTNCASAGISACVVASGSSQDLLPTINSLNGNLSLCCDLATFNVTISGRTNSHISSLAGSGTVDVSSGNLVISNAADDFRGTVTGPGGIEIAGGRQVLSGANSYSGGTYVTGGVVVANNTLAFGSGPVHMIDPTVNFAASGTYTNDFMLEVASPAAGDPSIFQTDAGVGVILSGVIVTGSTASTDPVQYVVIDGSGSVTLTNAGNNWLGTTTINSGSTLIGASNTISGSTIIDNGTLAYAQPLSGSVAQGISGSGVVSISGLGASEAMTFSGTNSVANGFHVVDGSAIILTGSNNALRNVSLDGANASVSIASTASLVSVGDVGVIGFADGNKVDNQGSIVGGTSVGVAVYGGNATLINGSASNSGALISGGYGVSAAGSSLSVDNFGTITGTNQIGIDGGNLTVTNHAGGQITGASRGILSNAALTLTNAGSVSANGTAVLTAGGGNIDNQLGGTINGGAFAFQSTGTAASTINNAGDLTGGVVSTGGGNLNITNSASGNIVRVVFGSAIDLSNGGGLTLSNAGDIVGSGWGVVGRNSTDSVVNSGRIASGTISNDAITVSGANAIELQQGGNVTNLNGGQITGQGNGVTGGGITIDNRAGALISGVSNGVNIAANSSVSNAGTISGGSAGFNFGVVTGANSTLTNLTGGTITGGRATQFSGVNDVLNNSGSITSTAATASQGYGAIFLNGGTVNNLAGGTITGQYRGVSTQGSAGSVTNAGTISSSTELAIAMFNGGTVSNQASGVIDGQYRGVAISGGAGTVTNAGLIRATVDNAVSLFNGGTVTNQAQGTLTALGSGGWGVYVTGGAVNVSNAGLINADTGIVTNVNGAVVSNTGTINGNQDGVMNFGSVTQALTNSGTIFATNGSGVNSGGELTLNNSGTISGGNSGLFLNAGGNVTNTGSILSRGVSGGNQDGVSAHGALSLTNSGSIVTGVNAGVVAFDSLLTVNNQAGGSITGGSNTFGFAINAKAGLDLTSGGTLNAGTGTTTAVLVDGPSFINLLDGSTTNGDIVSLGSGTSALTVGGLLNGRYVATAGTAADTIILESTGMINGALLGAGDDTFTTSGGAIGGAIDGGAGGDALTFDITDATAYDAGLFSGFEARFKNGVGTLTLSGTDGLAADFAVNAGTLVLSGGSALNDGAALINAAGTTVRLVNGNEQVRTISGSGAIDLGSNALILGGNDNTTYSGVISGTGSLAKFGTGVLTLSGNNSYSGMTQVSGGTLQLGASNVLANTSVVNIGSGATFDLGGFNDTIGGLAGAGTVALGAGRLTVDQAANTVFSGPITGTGGLTKFGSGVLNLTGTSSYTGATFVNGGTLAIDGSLTSAATINSGGTLTGNGRVGGVSVLSGGVLAPGNGIGLLTIGGPLSFAAGSIYQVDASVSAADRTSATGAIMIGGGTVQVLASGAAYRPLSRYTILDSNVSVSGTFANISSNLAFLTPGLEYDAKSVMLVLRRNDINLAALAGSSNQAAVGANLQSTGAGALYDALLVQSADGARQAYDALSGEAYASTQSAIFGERDRLQDAMATNQRRSEGVSLWLDSGHSRGRFEPTRLGSTLALSSTDDLLGGLNWTRGAFAATVAGGRARTEIDIRDRGSEAKVKSWLIGGQVAYGADLGLNAVIGANYASHNITTQRSITFPGFNETASSRRDGNGYHLFGQVGYATQVSGIMVVPFAGLSRDHLELDGGTENGGLAALNVTSASRHLTSTQVGVKLSSSANLGRATFTPRTSIAWQHVTGDTTSRADNAFRSAGANFTINGGALARDAAKLGVDLDLEFGAAKLVAGYSGTIGSSATEHTGKIAFQLRF